MTVPSNPDIFLARSDAELDGCFDAYAVLRPHLARDQFVPQVRRQEAQGFQIVALRDEGRVKSAAGFRLAEFMAWGRVLYIDDLTTLPEARGRGFAGLLLDWVTEYARRQGCQAVHLDTGYARHAAHRVYLSKGFELSSHHMAKPIV
ncbi:MAG: GNAT family N-acetyltransferase [Aquabacterium sp.]|jgi:GNAT superfamily N-acetyltransferase|uniref:GNAT family N-acetyltransferase n=1 Tax=Aquabacterium sp. TaxID=1872578 RepID=UPI002A36DD89|nr:GNAT family N-acetyltransferase [Aquabacterium sp.]MDX9843664.1 GNAT family N-acetyltransferase [Aquabacterium sp.]